MLLHEMPFYYEHDCIDLNYLFLPVGPMDKSGCFNLGPSVKWRMDAIRSRHFGHQKNLKVIVEVNPALPYCHGDTALPLSEVDGICETTNPRPPIPIPPLEATETERKIAGHIIGYMGDRDCLQIGIGGMPNLIGNLISESGVKDLSCHTEMFTECYMDLMNAGKITNIYKQTDVGKSVCAFVMGGQRLYDFVDHNPLVELRSCAYTNDPAVIVRNENVVSICSCLSVDILGNVSSESDGFRQITATGGQWDYHYAAGRAKNGRSFLCLPSCKVLKDGTRVSNIVTAFKPGTQVSVAANTTNFVVTEYGAVNLKGLAFWQRVEKLASVAHPDFRDDIFRTAEKERLWSPRDRY
jgi:acyl-CoA hydrolase